MAISTLNTLYMLFGVIVSAIVLWFFAVFVYKCKNKNFIIPFGIAAITGAITYFLVMIPLPIMMYITIALTALVGFYLVKTWYKINTTKALMIWLTWFVAMLIISYLLNMVTPINF